MRDGIVEVHHTIGLEESENCGNTTIGIDKGYTEVFVDSEGNHYGEGLGKIITVHSDHLKEKHQSRNKLRAIANKKPHKKKNIIKNNLGRKKLNRQKQKVQAQIKNIIYQATHKLIDKAKFLAVEDLTSPITGSKPSPITGSKHGKNITRRLSAWTKGVIAKALDNISRRSGVPSLSRGGSSVILVNSAYMLRQTQHIASQMDSRYGILLGKRNGDSFYCYDGVVLQADENAARNVLARLYDLEIGRWTPFQQVKSILLERTERQRLGLLNPDSNCKPQGLSTESELPENMSR